MVGQSVTRQAATLGELTTSSSVLRRASFPDMDVSGMNVLSKCVTNVSPAVGGGGVFWGGRLSVPTKNRLHDITCDITARLHSAETSDVSFIYVSNRRGG